MVDSLGVYISIPFCKAKCTFCNFASDAFASKHIDEYVEKLCEEIKSIGERSMRMDAFLPNLVDTIYFGGGTPSLLQPNQVHKIFSAISTMFHMAYGSEITLECAPGQLSSETLNSFIYHGLTRVSLGVQSFVDVESAALGRLHTREICLEEIERLRIAGIEKISIDLIAGLPLQTRESWHYSVEETIRAEVGHVSAYMLEIDEHSKLGREALRRGQRYKANTLPSEDESVEWYEDACDILNRENIQQYEISNFARTGKESKHNMKYWKRLPYLGFGLDAHSMLPTKNGAVRFQNTNNLNSYIKPNSISITEILKPKILDLRASFEEYLFLGLRLNEGINLDAVQQDFGKPLKTVSELAFQEMFVAGLVWIKEERIGLTKRGRALSNEVCSRILEIAD